MIARIIPFDNSDETRIPKRLLKEAGLSGDVEVKVATGSLVFQSASRKPRAGWEEAFLGIACRGEDVLDPEWSKMPASFDEEEWEWLSSV